MPATVASTISNSSRIWLCEQSTDDTDWRDLQLRQLPLKPPANDEVRIGMRAVAVNFPDLLMLQGRYQFRPEPPFAPGMEGCGDILALGKAVGNRHLHLGQRVSIAARCGLFAEQVNVPAAAVRPAPAELNDSEAAGFQVAFSTAWISLRHRARLQPKETLVVHGAGGGVGMAAVQLGHHLGATVLATGSNAAKLEMAGQWGADRQILLADPQASNLRDMVLAATDNRGADVIFDPIGGEVFRQSLRSLAWDGRLLVVGFACGEIASVPANIPLIKGFSVLGVRAGESCRRDPALARRMQRDLAALPAAGLKPHIGCEIPFERAPEALAMLAERRHVGKVVVRIALPQET